jgi:NMD protein affecting ribosome stability and mRNA decay
MRFHQGDYARYLDRVDRIARRVDAAPEDVECALFHAGGNVVSACAPCNASRQRQDWRRFIIRRAGVDAAERHLLQTVSDLSTKDLLEAVDQVPQVVLAGVQEEAAQSVAYSIRRLGFGAEAEVRDAATNTLVPRQSSQYIPRCPTCGSDEVVRITGATR